MINKESVRAVAFDLDDTLLRDDISISDYTAETLRALSGAGIAVIPASGRSQRSMLPFVEQLDCANIYIACNGAEIWDGETNELLHSEMFSLELGLEIAAFGNEHGCYSQTYAGDCFYFSERSVWAERYAAASLLQGVYVGDLTKFIKEPRNKILMMDDEEKIAAMLKEARERFAGRVSVTCSKPYFLEFNPLNATKGIALKTAAGRLGIKTAEIIAFGDSLNDMPMLREAGWSVTVQNGRPELREMCDAVCGTNQEDGVARYLREQFQGVCF